MLDNAWLSRHSIHRNASFCFSSWPRLSPVLSRQKCYTTSNVAPCFHFFVPGTSNLLPADVVNAPARPAFKLLLTRFNLHTVADSAF